MNLVSGSDPDQIHSLMYRGGAPVFSGAFGPYFSNPALAAAVMPNHLPQALKRDSPIFRFCVRLEGVLHPSQGGNYETNPAAINAALRA
jgi:hypothetical protein